MTTVAAVVVTFDAPESLAACLAALDRQTRRPDLVVVVDNASTPPVTVDPGDGRVEVLRSPLNGGPAGGFALGLEHVLTTAHDLAWVMDDDCEPEPGALERLLDDADDHALVVPELISEGRRVHLPAWCGILIPRQVIDAVGVPRRDFVWWAEDTEYLQWRIPQAGFEVRNSDAVVRSDHPRRAGPKPPWKYYYEARNAVYLRVYLKRHTVIKRLFRILVRVPVVIVLRGDRRIACLWMHTRGVVDGFTGRLGMRVALR